MKACPDCKSTKIVSTGVTDTKLLPNKGGMMASQIRVDLTAFACLECGHVDLHADPSALKPLAALQ